MMKQISWKLKVSIWYTSFALLIAVFSIFLITHYAEQAFTESYEEALEENLDEFVQELEIDEEGIEIGKTGFYRDDIVFSIYNEKGELAAGYVPDKFPVDTILKDEMSQIIESEELQWRTYDMQIQGESDQIYWIRAIMYTTRSAVVERTVLLLEIAILPGLVLLAAVGGFFITKRAFAPVEQIRRTAAQIAQGGDLKERVPERRAKGELQKLAKTFNEMLDTIERTIEEEKQFTADASHELRTPIAVVTAQSEYGVMDDVTEEERKEALQVILEQSNKMSVLVSQLLAMSRSENASKTVQYEKVDLSNVVEAVVSELDKKAAMRNIEIQPDIEKNLYIYADQMGVTRIFVNLIENAIQYGKEHGYIRVELKKIQNQIQVKVVDNGIGIKPEHLPNIFKRFYRVDKVRTAGNEVHAGLGLSMVQILVKNYGGRIDVDSKEGEGTAFTLHFPLYEQANIR